MEQTKLVPKRRFKEFQNASAWEQRKLGDMVEEIIDNRGKTPPIVSSSQYPLLEVASLGNDTPDYSKVTKYVDKETYKNWFRQHIKKGDILFATVGNTGVTAMMDGAHQATIAQNIVGFRPNEKFNSEFMLQMFNLPGNLKKAKRIEMGAVQPSVKVSQLIDVKYSVPSKEEQVKVGTFFANLDNLITLHQRKLEKMKALKSAYLSEMFPAEGERVPKRRFAGFTDPWEQRKLGELANFSKGNGYSKGDLVENGYPIILYGRLYVNYETVINVIDTFVDIKANSVISEGNEVIVPASGETAEDISRASVVGKPGIILGGDLNIIKPNSKIDPTFLALTISNGKQQKEMSKRAQGKSVVHLHNSDLKQVNFLYPELKEQQKIGQFFVQLDNLITLHQRKLEKLQNLKKAYLNEMFV